VENPAGSAPFEQKSWERKRGRFHVGKQQINDLEKRNTILKKKNTEVEKRKEVQIGGGDRTWKNGGYESNINGGKR